MKALITGVAGTGKSTISKALSDRGISSIDFKDIKGLCYWRNKKTKEKAEYPPEMSNEWFKMNERVCDVNKLKNFLDKQENLLVTGVASGNQTEYLTLFDKVFLLQCTPEIIINRLKTRSSSFGKTKIEQDSIIEWQKSFDPLLLSYGAILINNESSVDAVIGLIISQLN